MNFGARAREEVQLSRDVSVIAGANVERTSLEGLQRSFSYVVEMARKRVEASESARRAVIRPLQRPIAAPQDSQASLSTVVLPQMMSNGSIREHAAMGE
jgi:hypothetical protein